MSGLVRGQARLGWWGRPALSVCAAPCRPASAIGCCATARRRQRMRQLTRRSRAPWKALLPSPRARFRSRRRQAAQSRTAPLRTTCFSPSGAPNWRTQEGRRRRRPSGQHPGTRPARRSAHAWPQTCGHLPWPPSDQCPGIAADSRAALRRVQSWSLRWRLPAGRAACRRGVARPASRRVSNATLRRTRSSAPRQRHRRRR
jgi:hypothetical protein